MIIKNAEFITSAVKRGDFLIAERPIIAVCGKSNVGKSSFINMLANRKKLAKTSSTPGRTRFVNYFDFGEFVLADLPGYGFAKAPKSEQDKWAELMNDFFATERTVTYVLMLVDIRHLPTREDVAMLNYLHHYAIPFTVIATKSDKLGKSAIKPQIKNIANYFALTESETIAVSSEDRRGKDEVLSLLDKVIEVFYNKDDSDN